MNYEKRVITYLDLLGFKEHIHYTDKTSANKDGKVSDIFRLFTFLKKMLAPESNNHSMTKGRVVSHFSDLIVISYPAADQESLVDEIGDTQLLIGNCILNGFFVRGCVTYGDIVHTPEIIFGPGLISAYEIERNQSKYPRVIVDKAIVMDAQEIQLPYSSLEQFTSVDADGEVFIDYFQKLRPHLDDDEQFRKYLHAITSMLFKMSKNPPLREKYEWIFPHYHKMLIDIEFLHRDRVFDLDEGSMEAIYWTMKSEW
jgi:hypothetical protein